MKAYQISTENKRLICANAISGLPVDDGYEVVVRKATEGATMRQLGALFGLWVREEAERTGESENYIHRKWKAQFLARIYISEPQTDEQMAWVELLALYQQQQGLERSIGNHLDQHEDYAVDVVNLSTSEVMMRVDSGAGRLWDRLKSTLGLQQQAPHRESRLERHAKRISLSWATLSQMQLYMAAIEQHHIAEGRPLSVPDPDYHKLMKEAKREQRSE